MQGGVAVGPSRSLVVVTARDLGRALCACSVADPCLPCLLGSVSAAGLPAIEENGQPLPAAVVQGAGPKQRQLFPQDMRLQSRCSEFAKLQPSLATPELFCTRSSDKKILSTDVPQNASFSAPRPQNCFVHVPQIFLLIPYCTLCCLLDQMECFLLK